MRNLLDYANLHKTAWNIPQARLNTLYNLFDDFENALISTAGSHTPAQTLARQEAQAAATRELRAFVNQFLRFPPVTNVDRVEMGVPNHDTIRTDHFVVTENVDFVIRLSAIRELVIDFWIQGADHKAKPTGYDGAVIIWEVLDTPPADHSALIHHALASRTPYRLHFDETQRGKAVYIALAWQNARGIQGHWSDIKVAYVP